MYIFQTAMWNVRILASYSAWA